MIICFIIINNIIIVMSLSLWLWSCNNLLHMAENMLQNLVLCAVGEN